MAKKGSGPAPAWQQQQQQPPPPPRANARAILANDGQPEAGGTRKASTDPVRLMRQAEIEQLLASAPYIPLPVLDAIKSILVAAQAAVMASTEARALSDLEQFRLIELERKRSKQPIDRRAAQITELQRKFEVDYALKDTPSQFGLTMLGTRPLHSEAVAGLPVSRSPSPDGQSTASAEGSAATNPLGSTRQKGRDDEERVGVTKNSKRFTFEPGDHGFAKFKLAEYDRGQKLGGPGAKLGGYYNN
ncbi:hypothetical protein T492DRAFT_917742 [Pavlovales sp. CCMP2436]|nr:hypothetical protein T492DRAFT_917742 [Pavlovales sp. CCMP2436]